MFDLCFDYCSDSDIIAKLDSVSASVLFNSRNQIAFMIEDDNGLSRVLNLISRGASDKTMNRKVLSASLSLLMNLTSNDVIGDHIHKEEKPIIENLILFLQDQNILAGRCLVNLTANLSSEWIIDQGALDIASNLLCDPSTSIGLQKILVNLLVNLTSSHTSSGPRNTLASKPRLIKVLLSMLDDNAIATSPASAELASTLVSNIARGGGLCYVPLIQAGAVKKLLLCLSTLNTPLGTTYEIVCVKIDNPGLTGSILSALTSLSLSSPSVASSIQGDPRLKRTLEVILSSTDIQLQDRPAEKGGIASLEASIPMRGYLRPKEVPPVASMANEASLYLGARVLVHALAHVLTSPASEAIPAAPTMAPTCSLVAQKPLQEPSVSATIKIEDTTLTSAVIKKRISSGVKPPSLSASTTLAPDAFYLTFEEAAGIVGIKIPSAAVDSVSSKTSSFHEVDGQAYLPPMTLKDFTELQHLVQHVLLPQTRAGNETIAYGAVAQLFVISARNWGGLNESLCLRTLREPQVLTQVVRLLNPTMPVEGLAHFAPSPPPSSTSLILACLSLVERLAGDSRCREVMNEAGWLDALIPLLSSEEGIIGLMADRVLVRMHQSLVVCGELEDPSIMAF